MVQTVFRQIILHDEPRILSRLRSRHAERTSRSKVKPLLLELLCNTVNDPSIRCRGAVAKANLKRAQQDCENLMRVFSDFEAARDDPTSREAQDLLVDLMYQIHEFDTRNLENVLRTPPTMDPSTRDFLPFAIKKLRQYYGVAADLIKAARGSQSHLFKRVSVEVLEDPMVNTSTNNAQIDQVFQRLAGRLTTRSRKRHQNTIIMARDRFRRRFENCTTPWKIHAEIQLLFFYERNPNINPPRFICSSKSACYLCDLFLSLHGQFRTPKTHGRIYDRWTLPEWATDSAQAGQHILTVVQKFNESIEARLVKAVENGERPFSHPNESTLRMHGPWSSTSTLSNRPMENPSLVASAHLDNRSPSEHLSASSLTIQAALDDGGTPFPSIDGSGSNASRSSTADHFLSPGHSIKHEFDSPSKHVVVHTASIDLQVSLDWDPSNEEREGTNHNNTAATRTTFTRWIQVQQLVAFEIASAAADYPEWAELIDLEALQEGEEITFEDPDSVSNLGRKPLAIKCRDDMLLLRWSREEGHSR